MSLALVSVASAKVALNNFRRQNVPVDPDNLDHQQAYITLRDHHGRVNARIMMRYLNTQQEVVTSGDRNFTEYWAVPKANFPRGLPPHIAAAEISAQKARQVRGHRPDEN